MPETKVLIVEDEDALSTILEYNLAKEKFEVATATDGEEGLLKVEEFGPDIVILDWMLPKVSGIEVCRRIRSKRIRMSCKVLLSACPICRLPVTFGGGMTMV